MGKCLQMRLLVAVRSPRKGDFIRGQKNEDDIKGSSSFLKNINGEFKCR